LLQRHEFLLLPTSIVPPFPLEVRYVEACNGHRYGNCLEWMASAYLITLTGFPAISIPAGLDGQAAQDRRSRNDRSGLRFACGWRPAANPA